MVALFRYFQTTDSRFMRIFLKMKFYFLAYFLFLLATFIYMLVMYLRYGWSSWKVKEKVKQTDQEIYEQIKDEPVVVAMNVRIYFEEFKV